MFDFTGIFSRSSQPHFPMSSPVVEAEAADDRPMDHVVLKNGRPFAILNATSDLARRTLDDFVRSTPEAQWTLARC